MERLQVVSPVDGSVCLERPLADTHQVGRQLDAALAAGAAWRRVPLERRMEICSRWAALLESRAETLGAELTLQMGRPTRFAPRELETAAARARRMIELAPSALAEIPVEGASGFSLFIRREALGVVLVVPAWNYPWMIATNSVVPALLAGNTVLLKHSSQTPLVGERMAELLVEAGLPEGVCQSFHASHETTAWAAADPRTAFIAFTGSVRGGHEMVQATAQRFVGTGLELGGKDPAYVRSDADVGDAAEQLADGALFNSGQSCCAVERIYVHQDIADAFETAFMEAARGWRLGDPRDPTTCLGPLARSAHADFVRGEIEAAIAAGAEALLDPQDPPASALGGAYLAPQALRNVDTSMSIMREETFGPVVGIQRVASDAEAIAQMNDSRYGLTASVWTRDTEAALAIGAQVETGTWFMNRCDYLDPGLAWVGVKDSGRGCTLSRLGFDQLTRPKSFHLKLRA